MYDFFSIAQKIAIDYHIIDTSNATADVPHATTQQFITVFDY